MDVAGTTEAIVLFFGLYLLAAGVLLTTEPKAVTDMIDEFSGSILLCFLTGVVVFLIGAIILSVHNDWSGFLPGLVTLVGWAALIEGLVLIAARRWLIGMMGFFPTGTGFIKSMGVAVLVAGVVLVWVGLSG